MLKMLVVFLAFLSVSAFPGLQGAGGGLAKAADVPAVQTELSSKSDKKEPPRAIDSISLQDTLDEGQFFFGVSNHSC